MDAINFHLIEKGQGIVYDDNENTYPGCALFFCTTPIFRGKHPFFKQENTLVITKTPFFKLLPKFFFQWGEEAQVFGQKLPHPKVDRVLVLPVVGFKPGITDIAPKAPSTGPFNSASAGPTKLYCQFNPTHYYGATYTDWFFCNLIG